MGNPKTDNLEIQQLRSELQKARKKVKELNRQCKLLSDDRDRILADRDKLREQYEIISNAEFWRISTPIRKMMDVIKTGCSKLVFPFLKFFCT